MNPSAFLSVYSKLESLVQRLPETLRGPILRETTPIKTLFLLQRPPRIVLLGDRAASRTALVNALFGEVVAHASEDAVQSGTWQEFGQRGRGILRLLDARRPASLAQLTQPLTSEAPDFYIFLRDAQPGEKGIGADFDHAAAIMAAADRAHTVRPKLLGVPVNAEAVAEFDALHARTELASRLSGVISLEHVELLARSVAVELPPQAQLEMARLSNNRELQKQIAQVVIKSVTAISAAVAAQPIPLADFPILTSLQAMMVASIMHVSGREMSKKLAGEFLGALGANIGAGLVLREGARAAVKFVPIWGSAISGGVAAAGTYALGRAATAYFIEGMSLPDARRLLKLKRREKPLLKK